jgi:two-component system, cell cycle response regulator DivK
MYRDASLYNWSVYTILIVEDDVSSTFYLKEVLKDTQAEILHAADGQSAVELCKSNPSINIVLMDIRMPVMNGFDATRAIRLIRPDLPIIAQTANSMYDHHILCIEAGCTDFLAKPVDSVELLEKISIYLK